MDELNRQISNQIEKAFSVSGIENGGVELKMVFAPGTYMEHVLGEYTYRRLLLTARACSARSLWIKWKRRGATYPITISENIPEEELSFEICDDVPQKIREKEHRFLVSISSDEYQAAMGRKRITEWRDLVKKVIKRGELKRVIEMAEAVESEENPITAAPEESSSEPALVPTIPETDTELITRLQETVTAFSAPIPQPVSTEAQDNNGDIAAMLKNLLGVTEDDALDAEECEAALTPDITESVTVTGDDFDSFAVPGPKEESTEEDAEQAFVLRGDQTAEQIHEPSSFDEEELRRSIEAEIREKLLLEAKQKADAEAEELRRAHDALKAENERLAEFARKAEEERAAREAESLAETERLRREIEARERAEAIEKERMAEAARLAVLEQERLTNELAEEEKRRRDEEAEAARLAEAARIAEERRREAERINAEIIAEKERLAKAAELAEKEPTQSYNYISKNARLLFRRPIDPNITKRIHEIILTTIKYFKKENVYIKIKATVPDSTTVNLHFVKIPEEETELLINIIKVLGKSEIGIIKAILE